MKRNIFLMAALLSVGLFHAQIQINNGMNTAINNSNALIDGSTAFSTEAGAAANMGKGIVVPSVDLINFQFDLTLADGVTFPTYFDGMIVYNKATGNTLTTGNRPSVSRAVVPGFYYFSNPNGATNGNVTGGQWKPVGDTTPGDNLGNHSATQDLAMNLKELRLAGATNNFHSLAYNSTVDGPYLKGNAGGALGNANGSTALTWRNSGNVEIAGETFGGVDRWFRVRGVNSGIYWENQGGGWWMTDTNWIKVYNNKSVLGNNIIRTGDGRGYSQLNPGGAANTGYFSVHRTDNTRLGYIGFDNNNFTYIAENGASHVFNGGNVVMETEVYSGVNKWFRVRGSTGIHWENFGGGWYMEDTTWMRVYGNKNVYTAGVGRFDTRVETARVQGTSDKRFKKDIVKIYGATEKLNQLNGYTYTWRDKKEFPGQPLGEGKDIGVIAQEVEKVFPDAVMTNKEGYKSVNYNALIPVLIEALKESNQRIKTLEEYIRSNASKADSAGSSAGSSSAR